MARTPKIDNATLKRFERIEHKRKIATREKRVYFLIVCEGKKTEPNYFRSFEQAMSPYTLDLDISGVGKNTLSIVEHAIDLKNSSTKNYDSVWVVFDKDDFKDKDFDNAIAKAKANNIKCAWSNEAFELWYVLHFEYLNTGVSRIDYAKRIETQISKFVGKKFKYKKNDPSIPELLTKYGNQAQAIKWAKKLEKTHKHLSYAKHNPCTQVYALVAELNNPQSLL